MGSEVLFGDIRSYDEDQAKTPATAGGLSGLQKDTSERHAIVNNKNNFNFPKTILH